MTTDTVAYEVKLGRIYERIRGEGLNIPLYVVPVKEISKMLSTGSRRYILIDVNTGEYMVTALPESQIKYLYREHDGWNTDW